MADDYFILNGELETYEWLIDGFIERIARTVRTADDLFRTESSSRSNG